MRDAPPSDRELVATIADALPFGVWVARVPGGELVYANATFAEIMGMGARDDVALGEYAQPYGICDSEGRPYPEERMPFVRAVQARETVTVDDIVIHRTDGRKVYIRASARPMFDEGGTLTHVVIAFIDVSREKLAEAARAEAEERLLRAQRMEAVGTLAGGIAHDFNNLLATVQIIASTLRLDEGDEVRRRDLDQIVGASGRAVQLTRALLGFARRGKHLAEPVSVHGPIDSVVELASRTFGPHVRVERDLRARDGLVLGDRGQLEQALMNLALNARDAVDGQGTITFRSADVVLEAGNPELRPPLRPGPHVRIEVTDDGRGLVPGTEQRIFEPYFSTKEGAGRSLGAGLGLAMVYGIVESHGGAVDAVAGREEGTTLRILLPAAPPEERDAVRRMRPSSAPPLRRGQGTVLLVEDEPQLREAAESALQVVGYRVVTAGDGIEAVERLQCHPDIDVVLLDLVVPRMDGEAAFTALREIRPELPVVLMTGYAGNELAQRLIHRGAAGLLTKPFGIEALSDALAAVDDPR